MSTLTADRKLSELAIYGGSMTISGKSPERWRQVSLKDIVRIVRQARRDVNTLPRGGMVGALEREFARRVGTEFGLLMNSGTATLHSAFFAAGVGPGDEVIVPTYTFFASASPVLQVGGVPVFCDIDPQTLTLDPDDVERRITSRTKAICAVHVWGNPADMRRICEIAKAHNLAVVEDCSHAHGATFAGKPVGSWGDIGCFSMQGNKPVSGGELGIAVTSDPKLYDRMLLLGHYMRVSSDGKTNEFETDNLNLGIKYRPHLFGVLNAWGGLKRLNRLNELRRRNYGILCDELKDCPCIEPVGSYDEAERGGMLEFAFKYSPDEAGGWNVAAFGQAVTAEGFYLAVDRYTRIGRGARLLHETPLFSTFDYSQLGGHFRAMPPVEQWRSDPNSFPVANDLADRLLTSRPLTDVPEDYVRQCARAIIKVATVARTARDLSQ